MRADTAFWDASAIVPLCCRQPPTAMVRRLARGRRRMVVWWGTAVEARSALRRLLREGIFSEAGLGYAMNRLEILRLSWSEILPTEEVRTSAEAALDRYDLRAADAFQLAAGLVWCGGRTRERLFVCFDERLAEAALGAGFEVP